MFNKIIVNQGQRALLLDKHNAITDVLSSSVHKYFAGGMHAEVYSLLTPRFAGQSINTNSTLLRKQYPALVEKNFITVTTNEDEIALVYCDGNLHQIEEPSSTALYWKGLYDIEVKMVNIKDQHKIDNHVVRQINACDEALYGQIIYAIPAQHIALVWVDGELVEQLEAGQHGFWTHSRNITVDIQDTRVTNLDIAGQEILTKDKVTLRMNVSVNFAKVDPLLATQAYKAPEDQLYKAVQFAIRQAVGTRSLDDLLENKDALNSVIHDLVIEQMGDVETCGMLIKTIGIKDIILPGEMRDILNQVVHAEKQAQANVIKRREETAATRSLLNTAKVMENNQTLLRLKELEVLEKVTENIDNLSVYGGLEGLMKNLVQATS